MKLRRHIKELLIATVALTAAACRHANDEPGIEPSSPTTMLDINLKLVGQGTPPSPFTRASRAGEELPANADELLHSVRVIILDQNGGVEHNSLWDAESSPAQIVTGSPFPVKNDETKTLIFIGNERYFNVTDPATGETVGADVYFSRFYPAIGNEQLKVDVDAMRRLLIETDKNVVFQNTERRPLPITGIYTDFFIARQPAVSGHFYLWRCAAKYTYRLRNESDDGAVLINSLTVNNVAANQFAMFNATFTSSAQNDFNDYEASATPATSRSATFPVNVLIEAGESVEIGPIYLPEGMKTGEATPYQTALTLNGTTSKMFTINYRDAAATGTFTAMCDLPRNTHVVIDGRFSRPSAADVAINFTVCPWNDQSIDIPDYN